MKKLLAAASILLVSTAALFAATNTASAKAETGVERYAIYVGSNYGGKGREKLLYAGSDAQAFQKTMAEIGGVPEKNSWLLIDPTKESVEEAIESVSATIEKKNNLAKRSEFLFYYSGHSTEDELLLGDDKYDYSSLKKAITEVPSDIHVVILDSCYSGNFIRTKGGQKKKPFLMDDSSVVKGHAYLSSSSEKESSQESDEIESSYFTNAMITGLRGAADTSGDNKVSLTELYSYAFNDTLSKTEETDAGPQHPNYNITLVGSGDLILSDISSAEASVVLAKEAEGRFIIRDARGKLISEINKAKGIPITMALSAGTYTVVVITDTSTKQGTFILNVDDTFLIEESGMQKITRKETKQRGGTKIPNAPKAAEEEEDDDDDNEEVYNEEDYELDEDEDFLSFIGEDEEPMPAAPAEQTQEDDDDYSDQIGEDKVLKFEYAKKSTSRKAQTALPEEEYDDSTFDSQKLERLNNELSFKLGSPGKNIAAQLAADGGFVPVQLSFSTSYDFLPVRKKTTLIAFGIFGTSQKNILGIQTAGITTKAEENLIGVQAAGINASAGTVLGLQTAGISTKAQHVIGTQASGTVASADRIDGMQEAGIICIAGEINGSQASGVMNSADKLHGVQWAGITNISGEMKGLQVAGLFNYAKTLNGVQIGLINIAKEGKGFGIGLINIIGDGVHDLGYYANSDGEQVFQYQSGSKAFFTTAGIGFKRNTNVSFIGLGSRFAFGDSNSSLDLELLWKLSSNDWENLTDSARSAAGDDFKFTNVVKFKSSAFTATGKFLTAVNCYQIPAARLTLNLGLGKHFIFFGSATADLRINGWNDLAFDEGYARRWTWSGNGFAVYPSVALGIKLR